MNIADENQITIQQEPITEELEEASAVDTAISDDLITNNTMTSFEETIALGIIVIKPEGLNPMSLKHLQCNGHLPILIQFPNLLRTQIIVYKVSEESTEETNTVPPEQGDPKTQVTSTTLIPSPKLKQRKSIPKGMLMLMNKYYSQQRYKSHLMYDMTVLRLKIWRHLSLRQQK